MSASAPRLEPSTSPPGAGDAAPSHEGTLHLNVTATPADRRFLGWFAAATLVLLAAVIAVNVLVDANGVFGTGLIAPLVWTDRDTKATAYLALPAQPEVLILGSSHVMKLAPRCVTELTGQRAFNFGVNLGKAEDFAAILGFVLAHPLPGGKLTTILVGVDADALGDAEPTNWRIAASRRLAPYSEFGHPGLVEYLPYLIGLGSLENAATAYRAHRAGTKSIQSFDPDGLLHYRDGSEEAKAAGTFRLAPRIKRTVGTVGQRFRGNHRFSPARVELFRQFLSQARANGISIIAFMTPLHPDLEAALAQTGLAERTAATRRLLVELSQEGLLKYVETGSLAAIGGTADHYFDGSHIDDVNAAKLLETLWPGEARCAVQ